MLKEVSHVPYKKDTLFELCQPSSYHSNTEQICMFVYLNSCKHAPLNSVDLIFSAVHVNVCRLNDKKSSEISIYLRRL